MSNSIKKLREQLNLSLEDLGFYLGVNRSRVHHFESGLSYESGENLDKIQKLTALVKKNRTKKEPNPWIDRSKLQQKAREWRDEKKRSNKVRAEEMAYKLEEMKANYDRAMKALDTMAAILQDPECPKDVRKWISVVSPRAKRAAMKNNPLEQAKIAMRIVELGGGR